MLIIYRKVCLIFNSALTNYTIIGQFLINSNIYIIVRDILLLSGLFSGNAFHSFIQIDLIKNPIFGISFRKS